MTSCRTTAVWLGRNNSQSVLVHPTFLSRMSVTADHSLSHILPSSPACLRSAGSKLPMISRALGIKSRSVWKDLQDTLEITIQGSATTTGLIQENPSSEQFSSAFSIPHWFAGQVPADDTVTAECDDSSDITHEMTQEDDGTVSLNRHLMI